MADQLAVKTLDQQNRSAWRWRPAESEIGNPPCSCGKPSTKQCSRCKSAFYCSSSCQRNDWPWHKFHCCVLQAVEIKHSPDKGRILVSKRHFKAGEVLFTDTPLNLIDFGAFMCHFPALEAVCKQVTQYLQQQRGTFDFELEPFVFLPALQFVAEPPQSRRLILGMYCPPTDVVPCDLLLGLQCGAALLHKRGMLSSTETPQAEVLPKTAVRVLLISMANSFNVGGDKTSGSALFVYGALTAHSCLPNCSFGVEGTKFVEKAINDIQIGEEITHSYISPESWTPTSKRRKLLLQTKFFHCQCARCDMLDNSRGFLCPKCQQGTIFLQSEGKKTDSISDLICVFCEDNCSREMCQSTAPKTLFVSEKRGSKKNYGETQTVCCHHVLAATNRVEMVRMEQNAEQELREIQELEEAGTLLDQRNIKRIVALFIQCARMMTQHWLQIEMHHIMHDLFKLQFDFHRAARHAACSLSLMQAIYTRVHSQEALRCSLLADSLALAATNRPDEEKSEHPGMGSTDESLPKLRPAEILGVEFVHFHQSRVGQPSFLKVPNETNKIQSISGRGVAKELLAVCTASNLADDHGSLLVSETIKSLWNENELQSKSGVDGFRLCALEDLNANSSTNVVEAATVDDANWRHRDIKIACSLYRRALSAIRILYQRAEEQGSGRWASRVDDLERKLCLLQSGDARREYPQIRSHNDGLTAKQAAHERKLAQEKAMADQFDVMIEKLLQMKEKGIKLG